MDQDSSFQKNNKLSEDFGIDNGVNISIKEKETLMWLKMMGAEYICSSLSKEILAKEFLNKNKPNNKTLNNLDSTKVALNNKRLNLELNLELNEPTTYSYKEDQKAPSASADTAINANHETNSREKSKLLKDIFLNTNEREEMPLKPTSTIFISDKAVEKARKLADEAQNLGELRAAVMNFEGCMLRLTATNTVFGDGAPDSDIMLIGEAPGANEDAKGVPFCGESGKLLDNMMSAIGLSRDKNFYITNTIFWRPPGNRRPTDLEVEMCRPFVEKHIALINPKLLVLVGSTAATSLIGKHVQITKIRKECYKYTNKYLVEAINTVTIFHPAYLLRQPSQKRVAWHDLIHIESLLKAENVI